MSKVDKVENKDQKVEKSSTGTEIIKYPCKCSSGRSKRHPGVPPVCPICNMMHPREGSGTPVARLFHEVDALRGSTGPTPGAGAEPKASQNHYKNRSGNRCQKIIAKTMQKYKKIPPKSMPGRGRRVLRSRFR